MYLLLQFTCRYVHNVGRFFWVEQSYHCLDPRLHYWAFLRSYKTFSCCIRATEILPTQADHVGLLLSEQQCYLLSFTVSWFLSCLEGKRMCKKKPKTSCPLGTSVWLRIGTRSEESSLCKDFVLAKLTQIFDRFLSEHHLWCQAPGVQRNI